MKNRNYIYLFAVGLLMAGIAVSCQDELDYHAGEPDLASCYGVYFPNQEAQKDHEFEPSEEGYRIEFKVKRLKTAGEINVPYTIESKEGMSGSEIFFEDGQAETLLTVTLPENPEMGLTYRCNIVIDDPQYALKYYSDYKTSIDCSAVILKWNRLKGPNDEEYGLWRDDFITCVMNWPTYDNTELIIEERDDRPGYYRLTNIYTPEYVRALLAPQGMGDDLRIYEPLCDPAKRFYIDATNPEKVYIPVQRPGLDLTSVGATDIILLSHHSDNVPIEPSENIYGTLDKETGTITFPQNGLLMSFQGNVFYVNTRSLFRVMLPGFKPVDYSVAFDADFTDNGEVSIDYTFGKDVSRMRYAVYEGKISNAAAKELAQNVRKDNKAPELTEAEGTFKVGGMARSGVYTLVSANFEAFAATNKEADAYVGFSTLQFTYEATGDEVNVDLKAELNATNSNMEDGYTAENSLESFLVGKNIEEAYVIVKTGDLMEMDEQTIIDEYFTPDIENFTLSPVSEEILSQINGKGYTSVTGGLASGSDYTILIYASNGYRWEVIRALGRTGGEYDIKTDTFTYDKDNTEIYPAPLSAFAGKYDYYAVDVLNGGKTREYVGTVVIRNAAAGRATLEGIFGPEGAKALKEVGRSGDDVTIVHSAGNTDESGYIRTYSYPFWYTDETNGGTSFYNYMLDGKVPMPMAPGFIGEYRGGYGSTITMTLQSGGGDALLLAGVVGGQDGTVAVAFADTGEYYNYPGITYSGICCAAFDMYFSTTTKIFSAYDKPLLIPANETTAEKLRQYLPQK